MIIGASILFSISLVCFVISVLSFLQKGYLFNNVYIGASKEQKETMNKKPYYLQSGVIFFILGITFLLDGFDILFKTSWIFFIIISLIIITIIYTLVSSSLIKKNN